MIFGSTDFFDFAIGFSFERLLAGGEVCHADGAVGTRFVSEAPVRGVSVCPCSDAANGSLRVPGAAASVRLKLSAAAPPATRAAA
jgi:hypothetical protein